jgi:GTP-binding protein HflX
VLVYNKFDKLEDTQRPRSLVDTLELDGGVRAARAFTSALKGQGLDELRGVITEAVAGTLALRLNAAESTSSAAHTESAEDAELSLRPTGTQHLHSSP